MKTIRVNGAAVVRDIRQHTGLKTIMEKHSLSYPNLLKVRSLLVERGHLTPEAFDYLNLPEVPFRQTVSAKDFLASFRDRPDDLYLMEKYMLTAKDLQGIYDTLILAGLLSEYEYHARDRKAPELQGEAGTGAEDSTQITLLNSGLEMKCAVPERGHDVAPRKSFPSDSVASTGVSAEHQHAGPKFDSPAAAGTGQQNLSKPCPKCGQASDLSSPDVCIYCGVVFSKAKQDPKYDGVAIWEADSGDRWS